MVYKPKIAQPAPSGQTPPAKPVLNKPGTATTTPGTRPPVQFSPQAIAAAKAARDSVTVEAVVEALTQHFIQVRSPVSFNDPRDRNKPPEAPEMLLKALQFRKDDTPFWQDVMKTLTAEDRVETTVLLGTLPAHVRDKVSFAMMGGEQGITYMALMNQFAFMSYSNDINLSDVKGITPDKNQSTSQSANAILKVAGYEALPTIQGLWGFQMRVFIPTAEGKKKGMKTVVAFRGTEGVVAGTTMQMFKDASSTSPLRPVRTVKNTVSAQKDNESFKDSLTDFVPYPTGYSQYEANAKEIIDPTLKALGNNLIAVGHSLGGALAQLAVAKHPGMFSETYTFQGAKIQADDVQAFEARQKTLKASFYSINNDVVPTSGQASLPGMKNRFQRDTPPVKDSNKYDAVGGHNSAIMIEVLRQYRAKGMINKNDPLGSALAKYGSRDPIDKVNLTASAHDYTPYMNMEGTKQALVGNAQQDTFNKVYRNNAVYNAMMETVMPQLRQLLPTNREDIVKALRLIFEKFKNITPQVTNSDKTTWKAVNKGAAFDDRIKLLNQKLNIARKTLKEYESGQRTLLMGSDSRIKQDIKMYQTELRGCLRPISSEYSCCPLHQAHNRWSRIQDEAA